MYNTQKYTGGKWHGFSVDIKVDLVVVRVVEIDSISAWAIGIDMYFSVGIGIDMVLCGAGKRLVLRVWIEINLVFVSGVSKLTLFLIGDRNWLVFCARNETGLVFQCGPKMSWFWFEWLKFTWFRMRDGNYLGLAWASKLTWSSCWWSKWTWCQCGRWNLTWFPCRDEIDSFLCGSSKFTWFQRRDRNWLGFCVVVEIDLFLVSGSKLTRVVCRGIEIDLISERRSKWI